MSERDEIDSRIFTDPHPEFWKLDNNAFEYFFPVYHKKSFGMWKRPVNVRRVPADLNDSERTRYKLVAVDPDSSEQFNYHSFIYEQAAEYLQSLGADTPWVRHRRPGLLEMKEIPGQNLRELFERDDKPEPFYKVITSLAYIRSMSEATPPEPGELKRREIGQDIYRGMTDGLKHIVLGSEDHDEQSKFLFDRQLGRLISTASMLPNDGLCLRNAKPANWIITPDGNRAVAIDFDFASMGPREYDVASFLNGIEIQLDEDLVDECISRYIYQWQAYTGEVLDEYKFKQTVDLLTLITSMRDLGRVNHDVPEAREYYRHHALRAFSNIETASRRLSDFEHIPRIIYNTTGLSDYIESGVD